jgi:hypothetical protein
MVILYSIADSAYGGPRSYCKRSEAKNECLHLFFPSERRRKPVGLTIRRSGNVFSHSTP